MTGGREDGRHRKTRKKVEPKPAAVSGKVENRVYRHLRGPGRLAKARRRKLVGATVEPQEAELQLEIARGSIGRNVAQQATWSADATWDVRPAVSRCGHIT